MVKPRVELISAGVRAVLNSAGVGADLKRRAEKVAAAAGPGMRTSTYRGRDRWRTTVWTGTDAARRAEAEQRSLTRALDAARE